MSRVKICVWRPALQLHKVIQWVQSLFHWRKSTGSGPSSHLSSARVRTHPLQLLISTLKFGLWCMAPVWEGDWCRDLPGFINSLPVIQLIQQHFPAVAGQISPLLSQFFWTPTHLLYLERRVNTITPVPRPFKEKKQHLCAVFSPSCSRFVPAGSSTCLQMQVNYLPLHDSENPPLAAETFTVSRRPLASDTRPATPALLPHFIH